MGYYSTNSKLDGRFRTIKVRSKRPGIEVRSRRGYSAATAAEVATARAPRPSAVVPEAKAAMTRALGTIESDARAAGTQDRARGRRAGGASIAARRPATRCSPPPGACFRAASASASRSRPPPGTPVWTGVLLDRNGTKTAVPVVTGERTDAATGQRWLTADITLAPLGPGDYVDRADDGGGSAAAEDTTAIRVTQ